MWETTVNDVFSSWVSGGIFTEICAIPEYTPPWETDITPLLLDMQYHGNHSGGKLISPLVNALLVDGVLSTENKTKLASIIKAMFYRNWSKLWDTFDVTYKPLENAYTTETTERTLTDTGTVTDSGNVTHGEQVSKVASNIATQSNKTYGFNSSTAVPAEEQSGDNSGEETETHSGTDGQTNTRTDNLTHTENVTYNRAGSIGVVLPQQMLEAERKVWLWKFFDVVFSDVDKVIALPIF